MRRILIIVLMLMWVSAGYTNEEITVELPGGATMEFVWIEPGTFTMGTTEEQEQLLRSKGLWEAWFKNEQPAHEVMISKGFYLGRYEITQVQWEAVMETHPWSGHKDLVQADPQHPAVFISWIEVQKFIHRLNTAAGDSLYRLPTEAEWEYACRAGTTTLWSFGDDESRLGDYAWTRNHAVGTKLPNPWGLYDMHGNVWEWVQDLYWCYMGGSKVDPKGPATVSDRTLRGGYFLHFAQNARSANRHGSRPANPNLYIGARLLRRGPTASLLHLKAGDR